MKLTRSESNAHSKCLELLKQESLSDQEREYILINYHEGANNNNSAAGAFFTPIQMAFEFSNEVIHFNDDEITIIDLCAGIGMLSYPIITRLHNLGVKFRYVCIEYHHGYYEVGKKLLPQAEWYCMDICDWEEISKLGYFDISVSNPPFGSVSTFKNKTTPKYRGSDAEYKVIDVANHISNHGVFLIPQSSAGFEYSGKQIYQEVHNSKYKRFMKSTGLTLEIGMGIDTSLDSMYNWEYDDGTTANSKWKGVNPVVEFVTCDFIKPKPKPEPKPTLF